MSNDFLHSSPFRHLIDPIIYNFNDNQEEKCGQSVNQIQNPSNLASLTPSVSKFYNNSNAISGWTPLITKTIYNEQPPSFNSTPNKYVVSNTSNQEFDYSQGLNLTPFLNHNIGIISSNQSNPNISNITPFHDKTLQLTDFFIDSPIRQSASKELDTITPSKFRIGGERNYLKQSVFQDPKSASKRSITQIDTPPRQPHKLSITTKAYKNDDKENEEFNGDVEEDAEKKAKIRKQKNDYDLQTPSKSALKNVTNFMKTPVKTNSSKYQTPAKVIPNSSPSTVIISSAIKSPEEDLLLKQQASPTPKKENILVNNVSEDIDSLKPTMGVFSERKNRHVKSKSKESAYKSMVATGGSVPTTFKSNKAQMQAGMNKFQIVFTDVHTLMNSKNKTSKKQNNSNSKRVSSNSNSNLEKKNDSRPSTAPIHQDTSNSLLVPQSAQSRVSPMIYQANQQQSYSAPSSQDHNSSINTSKEISIISGNSSNLNMTSSTDQLSFDLGGLASTPNSKYFLDRMFDRNSPQSQNLMNQANQYVQHPYNSMPPPNKQQPQQHTHLLQTQAQQQTMMMMMMSTPTHQNTVNYTSLYQPISDVSPSASSDKYLSGLTHQSYLKDSNLISSNLSASDSNRAMMASMPGNSKLDSSLSRTIKKNDSKVKK